MGLHFYTNPDDVDIENTAAKLDRAAAQRRSAIRREASIRPSRDQSSSSGLTNIIRNRHELRQARMRLQRDIPETESRIEILEAAELERLRRQRDRITVRHHTDQTRERLVRHIEDTLNAVASDSSLSSEIYLSPLERDGSQNSQLNTENVLLPRPARESNLRFELGSSGSAQLVPPQPEPSFMPSPPHSLTDASRSRPVDGPLESWGTSPRLTQDFAPARAARAVLSRSHSPATSDRHGLETPPPESWDASYPPLRRVPHMSPRPLPRAGVDGLGDRHRSPSPMSHTQEERTWSHLLATMDDSSVPSTSTSFASVTDLLSTSRTSSDRSMNTQNTSTSFGEIGASAEDTCDLPPGITEEDVRQIRERHRRSSRRVTAPRRHIPEPDYNDRPLLDISDDTTDAIISSSSRADSPLSILLREARESRERRQRRRDELAMLQAIHERQQSNEHVPDEWWALAGISMSLDRAENE